MVMKGIQFVKTDNQGIKLKVKKRAQGGDYKAIIPSTFFNNQEYSAF